MICIHLASQRLLALQKQFVHFSSNEGAISVMEKYFVQLISLENFIDFVFSDSRATCSFHFFNYLLSSHFCIILLTRNFCRFFYLYQYDFENPIFSLNRSSSVSDKFGYFHSNDDLVDVNNLPTSPQFEMKIINTFIIQSRREPGIIRNNCCQHSFK